MLSSASGGQMTPLDSNWKGPTASAVWSPDSQWVLYTRRSRETRESQVVRIHPGSTGSPEILAAFPSGNPEMTRTPWAWSPTGEWILAASSSGLFLAAPDFKKERELTSRVFQQSSAGFSKDGRQVLAVFRNTSGQGAEWQLFSFDVATGAERKLSDLDFPVTTDGLSGFSLHPDGTRFATSIAEWPFDLWMLEGFDDKPAR